ncbi:MAG: ABC transporter permease [Christensenellaceae bacterium]|jgi:simple sugar transport system permease protein|nr:ABC transporter permease [Christensenellaceae bacterium]
MAMPILIAGMGFLFSERAGVVNIGAEGIMLFGALAGVVGALYLNSAWLGLLAAMLAGLLVAAIFALLTVSLHADQIVVGAGINILAAGLTTTVNRIVFGMNATPPAIPSFHVLPFPDALARISWLGEILSTIFSQNILVYLALFIAPLSQYFLFHTEIGLKIRAVGEYPKACDTVGIDVVRVRYGTILFSGLLGGAAGAYLSLGVLSFFMESMTAGRGFIALAAVVFGKYTPYGVLGAALLFGAGLSLESRLQALGTGIPYQFILMAPYILTILTLAGFVGRNKGPAASGIPYIKE